MRVYISGPITGVPDYMEKFKKTASAVLDEYPEAVIINPAEYGKLLIENNTINMEQPEPKVWHDIMIRMLIFLKHCTHICFMPSEPDVRSFGVEVERLWAERIGIEELKLKEVSDG